LHCIASHHATAAATAAAPRFVLLRLVHFEIFSITQAHLNKSDVEETERERREGAHRIVSVAARRRTQ
jgi:hypothetical protein